jgi:prepilin-type N-terminal cleavage/methylation domain-containing protein
MTVNMKARPGLTLTELMVGLVVAGVLATALVRLATDQSQLVLMDEGRSEARSVSRSALTIMESELRMVEVSQGVVDAARDSVTLRIPFRMGTICTASSTSITAAMMPVDSLQLSITTAPGVVSGYAWRDAGGTYQWNYTDPTLTNAATTTCTNSPANVTPIPGGQVLTIAPGNASAYAGAPILLYYRVRYAFRPSTMVPGTRALWRTQLATTNTHEELAAPFDTAAAFRFFVDGSATAQTAVPSPVTNIRGLELRLTSFNRSAAQGGAEERTPHVTAIFFENR